jgi:hypothetical protein
MSLLALAQNTLTLFIAQLEAQDVEVPVRRYLSPGVLPAWDGEQLAVNRQLGSQGKPGAPYEGTFIPGAENLQAQLAVSLVREVPTLSGGGQVEAMVPEPQELTEAGEQALTDAQALLDAAIAIHEASTLTDLGKGFAINGVLPMGPQGGLAANRLLLTMSL